ncbi:hypothetical protein ES702_04458 [subsurface metagenome]
MRNAKYIGLGGTCNLKDRWECPFCVNKGTPECRFTLTKKKRNKIHKCRFCGMPLKLTYKK